MTSTEFSNKVEYEGWYYALTEIIPSQLEDDALAEALTDTQEAFKILVEATPAVDVTFATEDDELDFG
jgi:hypothetical protein